MAAHASHRVVPSGGGEHTQNHRPSHSNVLINTPPPPLSIETLGLVFLGTFY
jgi:hypothetical protein